MKWKFNISNDKRCALILIRNQSEYGTNISKIDFLKILISSLFLTDRWISSTINSKTNRHKTIKCIKWTAATTVIWLLVNIFYHIYRSQFVRQRCDKSCQTYAQTNILWRLHSLFDSNELKKSYFISTRVKVYNRRLSIQNVQTSPANASWHGLNLYSPHYKIIAMKFAVSILLVCLAFAFVSTQVQAMSQAEQLETTTATPSSGSSPSSSDSSSSTSGDSDDSEGLLDWLLD